MSSSVHNITRLHSNFESPPIQRYSAYTLRSYERCPDRAQNQLNSHQERLQDQSKDRKIKNSSRSKQSPKATVQGLKKSESVRDPKAFLRSNIGPATIVELIRGLAFRTVRTVD